MRASGLLIKATAAAPIGRPLLPIGTLRLIDLNGGTCVWRRIRSVISAARCADPHGACRGGSRRGRLRRRRPPRCSAFIEGELHRLGRHHAAVVEQRRPLRHLHPRQATASPCRKRPTSPAAHQGQKLPRVLRSETQQGVLLLPARPHRRRHAGMRFQERLRDGQRQDGHSGYARLLQSLHQGGHGAGQRSARSNNASTLAASMLAPGR